VLLLRHGHKGQGQTNFNLSPEGFERATALARVLPACFGAPSHIRTFFLDPDTSKNARSYQTAVPLAVATGVNIRIDLASRTHSRAVGEAILQDPQFEGGRLVIFWEHRRLPELAAGLGWPAMPAIADDDFDRLYRFTYPVDSGRPHVRLYNQRSLLSGSLPCSSPTPP
jgi:broad specificity phosphatase PhoE